MLRFHFGRLRLGRRSLSGSPISNDTYMRIPSAPLPFVSTHSSANVGTNPGLQSSSENLCSRPSVNLCDYGHWQLACQWKMVHQHPPGEVCALSDNQPYWDERCAGRSSASEAAGILTPIRTDSDFGCSHGCQDQECCAYKPAVPTTAPNNDFLTPVGISDYSLSSPQSSSEFTAHQNLPTSSHFPNNDDEFFPEEYRYHYVPASPQYHERGLESLDILNDVANEVVVDPVSNSCENWCSPADWMRTIPNTAQLPETDRYSSNSHPTPTLYDSQNITSKELYPSHNARPLSPQPPNLWHTPTPSPSPKNLSDLITWDSSQWGQDAASVERLSPEIQVSIEASSVSSALPQSESISATVVEKENRCPLCDIRFTQSQVLNRHIKDKHGDKESCPHCPNFKWSRGRPYTYRRHLRVKHPGITFAEDPPGETRKAQVSRARRRKAQVTSREPPIPYAGDLRDHN